MNNTKVVILNDPVATDCTKTFITFLDFLNSSIITIDKDAYFDCMFSFIRDILLEVITVEDAAMWLITEGIDFKVRYTEHVEETLLLLSATYLDTVLKLLKEQGLIQYGTIQFDFVRVLPNASIVFQQCYSAV